MPSVVLFPSSIYYLKFDQQVFTNTSYNLTRCRNVLNDAFNRNIVSMILRLKIK